MAQKKHGSVKRFGSRYGRRIREQVGTVEKEKIRLNECPFCAANKVKWQSKGIFQCRKCEKIFTGKAFSPKLEVVTTVPKETAISPVEEDDEEEVA